MGSWGPFPKRGRREWLRSKFSAPSSQFPVPSSQFPGVRLNTFDAGRGPLTGALHHNDESLINTKRGYVHAGRGRLKQVQCDPKGRVFLGRPFGRWGPFWFRGLVLELTHFTLVILHGANKWLFLKVMWKFLSQPIPHIHKHTHVRCRYAL